MFALQNKKTNNISNICTGRSQFDKKLNELYQDWLGLRSRNAPPEDKTIEIFLESFNIITFDITVISKEEFGRHS
jgi:hypothetical protein